MCHKSPIATIKCLGKMELSGDYEFFTCPDLPLQESDLAGEDTMHDIKINKFLQHTYIKYFRSTSGCQT